MSEPYAYSVPQLARIWGVSERTVYTLVSTGKLGHLRIGNSIRIKQSDRDAYETGVWQGPGEMPR
ncbi:helix-turn-helix domain-containing protein [Lichenicoccus roseus]|uniref:Helix-turn-helix domain-containing protein n=1 Tax=Lichenicoccus roseus TaxID=2683649 RepID=A0A5R9J4N8_9PROT|nr:helix-turn-helix domain-containing protein [Lichenicoccus roseus]TLU71477.1 helix-turn-helix domain-containing protein [Lichenicoccus roseus]